MIEWGDPEALAFLSDDVSSGNPALIARASQLQNFHEERQGEVENCRAAVFSYHRIS